MWIYFLPNLLYLSPKPRLFFVTARMEICQILDTPKILFYKNGKRKGKMNLKIILVVFGILF